jgi:hypothetical protein
MADKSSPQPSGKQPRPGTGLERLRHQQLAPHGTRPSICWYRNPKHQPTIGWCPSTCNGPVTHSERADNGDKLLYCEAHAYWRTKTIRLPIVRRLQPGGPLQTTPTTLVDEPQDRARLEARVA